MKLILVICFLVAVNAQVPQPCESPKQWEANIQRVERGSMKVHLLDQRATISYDEINQRVREVDEFSFTTQKELYERIYLFKDMKEYRINLQTRQCNVSALTSQFRPFGVPYGAKFTGFAVIGAAGISGQFMNVQNWSLMSGQNRFYGVVTTPDCIPVEYTEVVPPAASTTSRYFDIKQGIRDPNVFTPPSECMK